MKQNEIPFYNDFEDFVNGNNKYPCNTQYMVYNGLLHKYFLTAEALNHYGIDVERKYIYAGNNKTEHFINEITDKVYNFIHYKVGLRLFDVMEYRIATAPKILFQDQYTFRKQFEKILVAEAEWLINNGNATAYSTYDMEKGGTPKEEETDKNLFPDIAPQVMRDLKSLDLTRWFQIYDIKLDTNKY